MSIESRLPKASSALLVLAIGVPVIFIWVRIAAMNRAENARIEKLKQWTVATQAEWPTHIVQLVREADQAKIPYGELTILHQPYHRGAFCWAFDYSPELFDLMKRHCELTSVDKPHETLSFALKQFPPDLEPPKHDDVEYFVGNKEFLEYGEGLFWCVLNDKPKKRIVVRYYYEYYQVNP